MIFLNQLIQEYFQKLGFFLLSLSESFWKKYI